MLKAMLKNRIIRIPDEKASEYLALGYTITDMGGKVLKEPKNTAKRVSELEAENAKLQKKIASLEAKLIKNEGKTAK